MMARFIQTVFTLTDQSYSHKCSLNIQYLHSLTGYYFCSMRESERKRRKKQKQKNIAKVKKKTTTTENPIKQDDDDDA